MNINSLIQTINDLETASPGEKESLINKIKSQDLSDELKAKIIGLIENELDKINEQVTEEIKKDPELLDEFKKQEKDIKLDLLANKTEKDMRAVEDQFNKTAGAVSGVLNQIEEAAARQKIADA